MTYEPISREPRTVPFGPPAPQTADEQAIVWGSQASAQTQLERERAEVRERFMPTASDGVLTPAMLDALAPECRDSWRRQAEGGQHGSWARAMRERADEFGLDVEQLAANVFSAWERECAVFPRKVKPGQPSRKELWYGKHSAWLRKAAGLGESTPEFETPRPGQFAMNGALRRIQ